MGTIGISSIFNNFNIFANLQSNLLSALGSKTNSFIFYLKKYSWYFLNNSISYSLSIFKFLSKFYIFWDCNSFEMWSYNQRSKFIVSADIYFKFISYKKSSFYWVANIKIFWVSSCWFTIEFRIKDGFKMSFPRSGSSLPRSNVQSSHYSFLQILQV